jgi:preprotein translocase SecE subunit
MPAGHTGFITMQAETRHASRIETNTMSNPVNRIKEFCGETVKEIKDCSWPERSELIQSTLLVITATILLTVFTMGVDQVVQRIVRFLIGA